MPSTGGTAAGRRDGRRARLSAQISRDVQVARRHGGKADECTCGDGAGDDEIHV
jgi:hypothetical protein